MKAKTRKKGSPKKRLKVTLIYPPGNYKNSEPIAMPNMSIAVLADGVIKEGHLAVQADIEKQWFGRIKNLLTPRQLSLLDDYDSVLEYVHGRAAKNIAAEFSELTDFLIKECSLERSDLFGISLIDMRTEPLIINFSVLLASGLKARFDAPVAIGSRRVPRDAFMYLMKKYPCFDYGVYAEWGEQALCEIIKDVAGDKAEFIDTVVRKGKTFTDYYSGTETGPDSPARAFTTAYPRRRYSGTVMRPSAPTPHYEKAILDQYSVTDKELFARYNSDYPFIRDLPHKGKKRLLVLYSFEHTCTGTCAFCPNESRDPKSSPSDAKSVDQVIDELFALKEKGVTGVYFMNSAFNNNYKRAEELCEKMIKYRLGLSWVDCANFWAIDERLLDKMKAAGAVKLTFGVETGSPRLLKYIRKNITIEKARRFLEYSNKIGIWNHAELIGGLPTEKPEDVKATIKFVEETKDIVDVYSLHPFYLYREAPFYCEPEKFGLKIKHNPAPPPEHYFSNPVTKVGEFTERFDEAGLTWEEKDRQILESTKAVADTIGRVFSYRVLEWGHAQLLMRLYDEFGHKKKPLIRKMMRILTLRFKPYNLDFFLENFGFNKNRLRLVMPPPEAEKRR